VPRFANGSFNLEPAGKFGEGPLHVLKTEDSTPSKQQSKAILRPTLTNVSLLMALSTALVVVFKLATPIHLNLRSR
jgi:hypothetical protein